MRYTITVDGLLITGSETGMVKVAEDRIRAKGRVGPGQCVAVDLSTGRFMGDTEVKDMLSARKPFGDWTRRTTRIDGIVKAGADEAAAFTGRRCGRRQLSVGYTLEELETILHPMVEEASEAVGSMGDDTPVAVLSGQYRGLHHYFRQSFSQVTNPPIDSLRETRVMTLKTRLGNLGNVLDEHPEQCEMLMLDSPVLSNAEFDAMRAYMGGTACVVDCTFPVGRGRGRAATPHRAHPPRGGGRGAQRLRPRHPDRRAPGAGARGDPHDPRGQRRADAPGPHRAAHLHQPQRPLRGVHRRALLRGAASARAPPR
jgi:glutamate synthase (NADPH/NADH) large chain